jgi:hypothetical protein
MLEVVIILILIGVALYCVNTMIPMDPKIKTIINIVVVLVVVIWLLQVFGLLGSLRGVPQVK